MGPPRRLTRCRVCEARPQSSLSHLSYAADQRSQMRLPGTRRSSGSGFQPLLGRQAERPRWTYLGVYFSLWFCLVILGVDVGSTWLHARNADSPSYRAVRRFPGAEAIVRFLNVERFIWRCVIRRVKERRRRVAKGVSATYPQAASPSSPTTNGLRAFG